MHNKIIVANWKMNGDKTLVQDYNNFFKHYNGHHTVVVCPSFTHILLCDSKNYFIGAQDCSEELNGAYTGSISAPMLREVGVKYVILGHSERRMRYFETDELIKKKEKIAIENDLIPIICIGESLEDKENGQTQRVLEKQLQNCLNGYSKTIIAYEPIWAIGTGLIPDFNKIEEIFSFIKKLFPHNIAIYGGSINDNNASRIMNSKGIDGLLIGGFSLNLGSFQKIL